MLKRCLRCDLLHGPSSVRCDHCGHAGFREVSDPLDRRTPVNLDPFSTLPVAEVCERPDTGACEKCGASISEGCQL